MSDLTITRTVERWARERHRQRLVTLGSWGGLIAVALIVAVVVTLAWVPSAGLLLAVVPFPLLAIGGAVWWWTKDRAAPDQVAASVDDTGETEGLIRTALAVEAGLAAAGSLTSKVVLERARGSLERLEPVGAPEIQVPLEPVVIASGLLLVAAIAVLPVLLFPSGGGPESAFDEIGALYEPEDVDGLQRAADELDLLAGQPGIDPTAKAMLEEARDRLRAALSSQNDALKSASELDRARNALQSLDDISLRSADALRAARPEALASGLQTALQDQDPAAARRLVEEVVRRVDGEASENETRRMGRALAEQVTQTGRAGDSARQAGQALQAGDRGGALTALADVMAALGEPARYEPQPPSLTRSRDAIEAARKTALKKLEEADERQREQDGREQLGPAPEAPGDYSMPTPEGLDDRGGQGDGGGGTAQGGTEDLRDGGTPGASGEEPEVEVDGPRPAGAREEGPDADGGRRLAGESEAREGEVEPDAIAGAGTGEGEGDGGEATSDPGAGASMIGGPGPSRDFGGVGVGAGVEGEAPLLDLDPALIDQEWVELQWNGAGETMEGVVQSADAGGRSGLAWGEVHSRYASLAESAGRRGAVPLTRRSYVQKYFEAIRPTEGEPE